MLKPQNMKHYVMSDVWNVHLSYSFAVAEILSNNHL